jgi:hypothetical protein
LGFWKKGQKKAQTFVTFEAEPAQIERLLAQGIIDSAVAQAGIAAGKLRLKVPVETYQAFLAQKELNPVRARPELSPNEHEKALLEQIAQKIHTNKLASAARLFLTANRPMSFTAGQVLIGAQPLTHLLFGSEAVKWLAQYSELLENRANLDWLLKRLDELES